MGTNIKICGLRREEDIAYVNEVMPEYAGFVLAPSFWRHVTPEEFVRLAGKLESSITPVAVFVDQSEEFVAEVVDTGAVGAIQLHGSEDEGFVRRVRARMKTENKFLVIKAVHVRSAEDIKNATEFVCDYLLLDAYSEGAVGGTGQTFDWNMIQDILQDRPFFLAGGLGPQNVQEAISLVAPYAVDVSSGVETDRKKDLEKMRRLVAAVRG